MPESEPAALTASLEETRAQPQGSWEPGWEAGQPAKSIFFSFSVSFFKTKMKLTGGEIS